MIEYIESAEGVRAEDLQGFFAYWGQRPTAERLLDILRASAYALLAREGESGRVVGYVTAVSDGISCAYIPHLEVLEAYRGRGIGSQLVRRLLARLEHLYMIDLICDEELQPFYARLGFQAYSGMIRRNYARQACE